MTMLRSVNRQVLLAYAALVDVLTCRLSDAR